MLTFFEKQIYFLLIIIIISYININKKIILQNGKFKSIYIFIISLFFDYFLNFRFGSNGLIWWFLTFYPTLNKQFFSFLIIYIFYLNNFISKEVFIFTYLLINSFLYKT